MCRIMQNVQQQVPGHLATHSKGPMTTHYANDIVQTAGDSWQTTNAADRKCQKLVGSSPSGT